MSNTANIKQWLAQSDIDYFTCFVKAWIPFNAWYRHNYDSLEQERAILDEIKKDGNRIRSRFIAKLDGGDPESEEVRNHIAALHRRLSLDPLQDRKKRRISFERVLIGQNPQRYAEHKHGHWFYKVDRIIGSKVVTSTITSNRGNVHRSITQMNGWNIEEFELLPDYLSLSPDDRAFLQQCYSAADPCVFKSLLAPGPGTAPNVIEMDSFHFINDKPAIFAGVVEVIYSMRNLLFHGELVPDPQTNRTYEPAYHVMRWLLETIV